MGKLNFGRVLECFYLSSRSSSSLSISTIVKKKKEIERKPLIGIAIEDEPLINMKDKGSNALATPYKPKMVMLKVSMHCNGCARKVEKHIKKIEGVSLCHVDLQTKLVTVIGDNIVPRQVLESISKVKNAELLTFPPSSQESNISKKY